MRNLSLVSKKSLCCWILIVALCGTTGCAQRELATVNISGRPFYLATLEPSTAQIWQVSLGDGSSSVIYEISKNADRAVDMVFPPEELERLQSYLAEQSIGSIGTVSELLPEPYIDRMTLSTTGNALAWIEGDIYPIEESATSFGVQRLMVLNVNSGDPDVLLQIPLHAEDGPVYYTIDGPSWSQDGQSVAIIRGVKGSPVEASLIVVDVSTRQSQEIKATIDSSGPVAWSPDSTMVAWSLSRWHTQSLGGAIRICTLCTEECRDIELEHLWARGHMDWSPDGNVIAFAASNENPNLVSEPDARLYTLDVSTGSVQEWPIPLDGVLENPQWSPDGQFLASDYRSKLGDFFQSLVIVDPTKIVGQLSTQRTESSWVWSDDGRSILVLIGIDREQLEVGLFSINDSSLQMLELSDELSGKQIGQLSW
jgi:Tol biopolymer transport system component